MSILIWAFFVMWFFFFLSHHLFQTVVHKIYIYVNSEEKNPLQKKKQKQKTGKPTHSKCVMRYEVE